MEIDIKLLDECPVLTDYEKDLIRRIDINHETQASVAKFYEKTASTISTQHKKALAKLDTWIQSTERKTKVPVEEDFSKRVFRMFRKGKLPDAVIAEVGRADEVISLWEKYCELKGDDYYKAQSKLAELGYEANGDSGYPLCEQVDCLIGERDYFADEEEEVRAILEEHGVKGGSAFGGYGSISEGVKRLGDKLRQTQSASASVRQQKEDLSERLEEVSKQLEETMNKLSNTERTLDETQQRVAKLQRLEKYEHMSEEKRKSLRLEIEMAQKIALDTKKKVEELQLLKTKLDNEVNWLRQNKEGAIDSLMQVKANVKKDIEDSVLEILGNLQLDDVLKLYNTALKRKIYKTAIAQ